MQQSTFDMVENQTKRATLQQQLEALVLKYTCPPPNHAAVTSFPSVEPHVIRLTENRVVHTAQYRLAHVEESVAVNEVDRLSKLDVIEPSNSPFNSPVLLIRKRDGTFRFVVDLRALNSVVATETYVMPSLAQVLDSFAQSTIFSCLDLANAYWHVPLSP